MHAHVQTMHTLLYYDHCAVGGANALGGMHAWGQDTLFGSTSRSR